MVLQSVAGKLPWIATETDPQYAFSASVALPKNLDSRKTSISIFFSTRKKPSKIQYIQRIPFLSTKHLIKNPLFSE